MTSPARTQRTRTRQRERKIPDTSIASPCIGVCMLNNTGLCDGCLRNIDEIREWIIMDREEKLAVLAKIAERQQ